MSSDLLPEPRNALDSRQKQHNILISIPRTASNLLTHLLALSDQPSTLAHPRHGYFFLPALSHRFRNATLQRPYAIWSDAEKQDARTALQSGISAWEAWVANADAQGLGTYVKEHISWTVSPAVESSFLHPAPPDSHSWQSPTAPGNDHLTCNPTVIPDTIWSRVRATFLIRHPALTFPSALRAAIDNESLDTVLNPENRTVMRWECTFHWHLLLYKFLVSQKAQPLQSAQGRLSRIDGKIESGRFEGPLIIDASQLRDPGFVRRYAVEVGLDPDRTRTKWEATSAEAQSKLDKTEQRMKDTLLGSTGVVRAKLYVVDIDVAEERKKWEVEFGNVLADQLEGLVRGATGEYEWLFERRWRG